MRVLDARGSLVDRALEVLVAVAHEAEEPDPLGFRNGALRDCGRRRPFGLGVLYRPLRRRVVPLRQAIDRGAARRQALLGYLDGLAERLVALAHRLVGRDLLRGTGLVAGRVELQLDPQGIEFDRHASLRERPIDQRRRSFYSEGEALLCTERDQVAHEIVAILCRDQYFRV
jgi:hypothetical protein